MTVCSSTRLGTRRWVTLEIWMSFFLKNLKFLVRSRIRSDIRIAAITRILADICTSTRFVRLVWTSFDGGMANFERKKINLLHLWSRCPRLFSVSPSGLYLVLKSVGEYGIRLRESARWRSREYNTLQQTTTHGDTLQHNATCVLSRLSWERGFGLTIRIRRGLLPN